MGLFQKKNPIERYLENNSIPFEALPKYLRSAIQLQRTDAANQTPEEAAQSAQRVADDIADWYEDLDEEEQEELTDPAPENQQQQQQQPAPPAPAANNTEVLQRLFDAGTTRVTLAHLRDAGYKGSPGPVCTTHGDYMLKKALFASTYTISKKK